MGSTTSQEILYYQDGSIAPSGSSKVRKVYTLSIETEEHIAKVRWVKSEKAVRASILLVQQEDLTEVKRVLVVVPMKWKFIEKIEAVRDNSEQEKLSELVFNWRFWDIISYWASTALGVMRQWKQRPITQGSLVGRQWLMKA